MNCECEGRKEGRKMEKRERDKKEENKKIR